MSDDDVQFKYGLSKNLFIAPKPGGRSLVVGGVSQDDQRWTRVLSLRAARLLWFSLVELLYPEQAAKIKGTTMTTEMRDAALPTVTDHVSVEHAEGEDILYIIGYTGPHPHWRTQMTTDEAKQFLAALHKVINPKDAS